MTTLVEEEPYVAVVKDEFIPYTCAKCFAWNLTGTEERVQVRLSRCIGCRVFYYCSAKCQKEDWKDHKPECRFLRSKKTVPSALVRLLSRTVRKSRAKPGFRAFNGNTFDSLVESASKETQYDEYTLGAFHFQSRAIYLEMKAFMGPEVPDLETVSTLNLTYNTQSFHVFDGSQICVSRGYAFYVGIAKLRQTCRPTAFIVNSGAKLRLRTIKEDCPSYNDELTINTMGNRFFRNTAMRRDFMKSRGRIEECQCEECLDIESDMKRTSGRPSCCPTGWFSLSDHICSVCHKEVDSSEAVRVLFIMEKLRNQITLTDNTETKCIDVDLTLMLLMFSGFKTVLSDRNTCLMEIADKIYNKLIFKDNAKAVEFADLCVQHSRDQPFCLYHANLLCKRFLLYVHCNKPAEEIKRVLDEALETVEIIYGGDHELTRALKMKKEDPDCGLKLMDLLHQMTTLMEEQPFAAVVKKEFIPFTCAKCFAWNVSGTQETVTERLSRCAGCHVFYYCSHKCQSEDWKDHKHECYYIRSTKEVPNLKVRLIARMLRKSGSRPDLKAFNGRTYDSLVDDCSMYDKAEFLAKVRGVYTCVKKFMGCSTPDFETVLKTYSKCARNSFTVWDGSPVCLSRGEAVYLGLSGHKHSCRPDAFFIFSGSKLVLRTTKKDAVYSDNLTICHPDITFFHDTMMRRAHLQTFCIDCKCEECRDQETDEKRKSGRPSCCPNGWFSLEDGLCSICNRKVSIDLKMKAAFAIVALSEAIFDWKDALIMEQRSIGLTLAPKWIYLFETHKKVLSDENTYLIEIADMIYRMFLLRDPPLALNYLELCLPQARNRPYCHYRAIVLCSRFLLYEDIKKSPEDIAAALDEALETVEIFYGENHELTKALKLKKKYRNYGLKLKDFEGLLI